MKKNMVFSVIVFVGFLASVMPASAQFCQDGRGEYIGGVYFPNSRPGYDRAGYMPCTPQDYAQMSHYFPGYGNLDWFPYGGALGGGYWGLPGRGGFYPYLNGYGQPLGPVGKGAMIGGALGAGIGVASGGARGGLAGVLIGAAGGAIVGTIVDHRHNGQSAQRPNVQQFPVAQEQPTPQVIPYPVGQYQPRQVGEVKIVRNRIEQAPVRVHLGTEVIKELAGGEDDEITLGRSERVWFEAYVPNPRNENKPEWLVLPQSWMTSLPNGSGWEIRNPSRRPAW